jgi:hypothetical protein
MRDTFPFLVRLGLQPDASAKEIRSAYARELKKIDQSADPAGFQELREAYELARQWQAHHESAVALDTQAEPQSEHAPELEPSPANAPQPGLEDPYELADHVYVKFADKAAALAQSSEARHQSRWKAVLQDSLNDDALLNLTARTIFEARIAHLLASGWKPGHEVLFVAACEVFDWTLDGRRILQFGEAGALINRAIDEWKVYESMPAGAISNIKQLIQAVRATSHPEGVATRNNLMLFQELTGRFHSWFTIIIDRENLQNWFDAAQAESQRGGAQPASLLYAETAQPSEKKSGWFNWQIFIVIIMLARGCASLLGNTDSSHDYSPPPSQLPPAHQTRPSVENILDVPNPGSPTEEQLRAVHDRIFYVPDPAKVLGVLKVSFEVELNDGGKVIGLKKIQTSRDPEYDEAVARALRNTNVFPPGTQRKFSVSYTHKTGGF